MKCLISKSGLSWNLESQSTYSQDHYLRAAVRWNETFCSLHGSGVLVLVPSSTVSACGCVGLTIQSYTLTSTDAIYYALLYNYLHNTRVICNVIMISIGLKIIRRTKLNELGKGRLTKFWWFLSFAICNRALNFLLWGACVFLSVCVRARCTSDSGVFKYIWVDVNSHAHTEVREYWVPSSITLCHLSLRQIFSLILELFWELRVPVALLSPPPQVSSLQVCVAMDSWPCIWGISALTYWAITSAPIILTL